MALADDIAYDRENTLFNTSEFAYTGTFYAPGSAGGTSFLYLERDLPDLKGMERRELFVDDDGAAIEKNYTVDTADGKAGWRVHSTGLDYRGRMQIEVRRQLKKD